MQQLNKYRIIGGFSMNTIILTKNGCVHAVDLGYQTFTRCGKIITDYSKREPMCERNPYTVDCEICMKHFTYNENEIRRLSGTTPIPEY
jgi:hypothetical protein